MTARRLSQERVVAVREELRHRAGNMWVSLCGDLSDHIEALEAELAGVRARCGELQEEANIAARIGCSDLDAAKVVRVLRAENARLREALGVCMVTIGINAPAPDEGWGDALLKLWHQLTPLLGERSSASPPQRGGDRG